MSVIRRVETFEGESLAAALAKAEAGGGVAAILAVERDGARPTAPVTVTVELASGGPHRSQTDAPAVGPDDDLAERLLRAGLHRDEVDGWRRAATAAGGAHAALAAALSVTGPLLAAWPVEVALIVVAADRALLQGLVARVEGEGRANGVEVRVFGAEVQGIEGPGAPALGWPALSASGREGARARGQRILVAALADGANLPGALFEGIGPRRVLAAVQLERPIAAVRAAVAALRPIEPAAWAWAGLDAGERGRRGAWAALMAGAAPVAWISRGQAPWRDWAAAQAGPLAHALLLDG